MNAGTRWLAGLDFSLPGWTLLHFLWQGLALAALLQGALWLLRERSAQARYLVATGTLLLMALCPALTFLSLRQHVTTTPTAPVVVPAIPLPAGTAAPVEAGASAAPVSLEPNNAIALPAEADGVMKTAASRPMEGLTERTHAVLQQLAPWLTTGWLLGVCLCALRLLGGSLLLREWQNEARPLTDDWQARVAALSHRFGLRSPVRVLATPHLDVPTVLGGVRSVVLLPMGALLNLPPQQVEALLAHELAHLRRYDPLVNLGQACIETLLFYHPAVWWVSRRIRAERELCCDDLVVALLHDRFVYANALTSLETLRVHSPSLTLAGNGGELMFRIRRILGLPHSPSESGPVWAIGLLALSLLIALPVNAAHRSSRPQPVAAPAENALTTPPPGSAVMPAAEQLPLIQPETAPLPAPALAHEEGKNREALHRQEPAQPAAPLPVPQPAPKPEPAPSPEPHAAPRPMPEPEPAESPQPHPTPKPAPAPKPAPSPQPTVNVAPPAPTAQVETGPTPALVARGAVKVAPVANVSVSVQEQKQAVNPQYQILQAKLSSLQAYYASMEAQRARFETQMQEIKQQIEAARQEMQAVSLHMTLEQKQDNLSREQAARYKEIALLQTMQDEYSRKRLVEEQRYAKSAARAQALARRAQGRATEKQLRAAQKQREEARKQLELYRSIIANLRAQLAAPAKK